MKDNNKEPGEELLEVDEKGKPIEKAKEEKKEKSYTKYKIVLGIILDLIILVSCYFYFNYNKNNKSIFDKTTLKNLKLKNRVFFGPIIHDAKKIENIAKNDVAFVITDGAVVGDLANSKSQKNQFFRIDSDEYIPEIKKLSDIVHKYNSYILLDLVHLGIVSSEHYTPSGGKLY